ncbi:MAG TPA: carbohydrate kinase [Micromonosporaceae bacterium]|nr:carbohydrate kinase [Micromonosporaceae bacterium]
MTFLVVGESLVDLIGAGDGWTFQAAPGGSPLNVAVGLAAHGRPVRLASEVGDDLFGGLVRDHLRRYGVDDADVLTGGPTSLAVARIDAAGVATYDFRFGWAYAARPSLAGVDCVHVGSLAALVEPGAAAVRALVRAARDAEVVVSYDPNVRPALVGERTRARHRVEELVALADLVKVSAEDLAWLHPGEPAEEVAAGWRGLGPRLIVVTRGGDGATAVHDGGRSEVSAPLVTVVDTVGAGDSFTAALLAALSEAGALAAGRPPAFTPEIIDHAVRYAAAAAAAVCAHLGALPPTAAEIAALLDR